MYRQKVVSTFDGNPCKHGHLNENGKTKRYECNNACIECSKILNRRAYKRPEVRKKYQELQRTKERKQYQIEYGKTPLAKAINQVGQSNHRAKLTGIPGVITGKEWLDLKEQYGFRCLRCGIYEHQIEGRYNQLTLDHITPFTMEGCFNVVDNIQPLCFLCNCKKHEHHQDYRPENGYRPIWRILEEQKVA